MLLALSCDQTKFISNGVSDNKPLIFEDEYEYKNLKEINLDGSAFWGIPISTSISKEAKHNSGRITYINGVKISKSNAFVPVLGMISYSFVIGSFLNTAFGQKPIVYSNGYYNYYDQKDRLPLLPAILIAIPFAGALNNVTFGNSALGVAGAGINYKLITDNPDVDVFYYPKYEISNKINFWTQKAYLKANVKGATQIMK